MEDWQQFRDAAQMENGETVSAVCEDCGETFEYIPMMIGLVTKRPLVQTVCAACHVVRREQEDRERALEEKKRRYDLDSYYEDSLGSDIGSRLLKASFAEFKEAPHNAAALRMATEWMAEEHKPNLIIVGPIGCGKSYLAACIHNALHSQYERACWLNAGSMMALVRRGFSDKDAAHEAGERMHCASHAKYLVFDDLGKVHPGKDVSWVEETFYAIIEDRYRNERPTVVTTEWKSEALVERVGKSVVSRIEDGAWVAGIKAPAEPYRKRAA